MKRKKLFTLILAALMIAAMLPAGHAATSGGTYYISGGSTGPLTNGQGFSFEQDNGASADAGNAGNTPAEPAATNQDTAGQASSGGHTHTWQFLKTETEATCTSYGQVTRICYGCGATQMAFTNMLPHIWGEWEILVEATDHSTGERQHTCEVCGTVEKETYYPEGTILPGTSGMEVGNLQDLLNENGIPCPRDGEYGDVTREGVRKAQRRNGLTVDGVAWPQTMECLRHRFSEWEILEEATLTHAGRRHRICEKCGYEEIKPYIVGLGPGARGDAVKDIQEILEELGYYHGRRDGDYGMAVTNAVEDFQEDNNLEPTGTADEETIDFLLIQHWEVSRGRPDADVDAEDTQDDIPDLSEDAESTAFGDDSLKVNPAAGVPLPGKKLEDIREQVAAAHLEFVVTSRPANGEYYVPGEKITYFLRLVNDGTVPILSAEGWYCDKKNLDCLNGKSSGMLEAPPYYMFSLSGGVDPGYQADFKNSVDRGITDKNDTHTVSDKDEKLGEYTDFASASVVFENGEKAYPFAELRLPIGDKQPEGRALFYYSMNSKPKNGLFYTEGETISYTAILENICDLDLTFKSYFLNSSFLSGLNNGFKAHSDSLPAHHGIGMPQTVFDRNNGLVITEAECLNGGKELPVRLVYCTFADGTTNGYTASYTVPCGENDPGAKIEIVETSTSKKEGYYTEGEIVTYDVVLTNTGNLTMSFADVYLNREGTTPLLLAQPASLAPGASVTVYSDSREVTEYNIKNKSIDVSVHADCTFLNGEPGGTALPADDAESFPLGGMPSAVLHLTVTSLPENDKYVEGESVTYSARLANSGDITVTGASLKFSFNGGEGISLPAVPPLAPLGISQEYEFSLLVNETTVLNDTLRCVVSGECSFADGSVLPVSAEADVDIGNPAVKVDIAVSSTAPDGFYKRNDSIEYQVTVSNIGNMDFQDLNTLIFIPDGGKGYSYLMQLNGFAAGASETRTHIHTVSMEDVAAGMIHAEAEATGILANGKECSASAAAEVLTGMHPAKIGITKAVSNSPANGIFYVENEVITYTVTVSNNGKEAVPVVTAGDNSPAGSNVLGSIVEMQPGDSETYQYSYAVTAADVQAGNVHNDAVLGATLPDGSGYSGSASADSAAGINPPAPEAKGESDETGIAGDVPETVDSYIRETGPVTWYLHTVVTDGAEQNALGLDMEMHITLYPDGQADVVINEETTSASWTEKEETITVKTAEAENDYTKVEDMLESEQNGSLMIFKREKPEALSD